MPIRNFDKQHELELIGRRYANVVQAIPFTLGKLRDSQEFLEAVKSLRDEGWKDWQILQAICQIAIDWRVDGTAKLDANKYDDATRKVFAHLMDVGEKSNDPSPSLDRFSLDTMHQWLDVGVITFLKQNGCIFRPVPYHPERLKKIADKHFNYFGLDIPHQDPFS